MNRFRTIAVTAIAGFVLVACGPSSSGSPTPTPQASLAAQGSGGPQASFSAGVVADLEALIPGTIAGITLQKASMRGNDFLAQPGSDPNTIKFLQDLGVSPKDISMATGFGFATGKSVIMFVFRAAGADSGKLVSVFKQSTAGTSGSSPIQWSSANVGGKQVEQAAQGAATTYLYVKGDTLIFLSLSDPAVAAQVLGGLP